MSSDYLNAVLSEAQSLFYSQEDKVNYITFLKS